MGRWVGAGEVAVIFLQALSFHIRGLLAVECVVKVNQEPFMERLEASRVNIQCTFAVTGSCQGLPDILWFRLSDTKAIKLDTTNTLQKFRLVGVPSEGFASLQIRNTNHNDSGIYYCGVSYTSTSPLSKQTGNGTILVIRAHDEIISMKETLLQSVLITILGLYSLCITVLLKQTINCTRKTKSCAKTDIKKQVHGASEVSENKHTDFQWTTGFHALTKELNNKYKHEAACEDGENGGTLYENTDLIYAN